MSYDSAVLRRATARLEEQKNRHADARERLRREVYEKSPRIAEIDRQLRRTYLDIVAVSLRNGTDPGPAIRVLRDNNLSLQQEREELLLGLGYPVEALEDAPLCPKCSDSGWRGAVMCDCLKQLCTQEQIAQLSRILPLGEQSFDTFSLDYYADTPWPGESRTPRENMEFIYEVCLHYAQKFTQFYFPNLLFTGSPGLGKTFLSSCIARVVSENGYSVVYDTAISVFARFEEQKFAKDAEESRLAKEETKRYLCCDLLILDDLGSELTTPFVQSALYTLVDTRLREGRRTLISTNLNLAQIKQRYSLQVGSRLDGEYHALRFYGEDIRQVRKRGL